MDRNTPTTASRPAFLQRVEGVGPWLAPLGLRALLAWEFFEAGRTKLAGQNWFADLADRFPLPFSLLPANLNWTLATWLELSGGIALLVGLGTRWFAAALWVLTIVAIYAVHWPAEWSGVAELWQGYAIRDEGFGNYKLPLIYLLMLLPLILNGGGRFSLDHFIASRRSVASRTDADAAAWGVVTFAIGLTLSVLLPWFGSALAAAGIAIAAWPERRNAPPAIA